MQKINLQEPQRNRNATANFVNLIRTSTVSSFRSSYDHLVKLCYYFIDALRLFRTQIIVCSLVRRRVTRRLTRLNNHVQRFGSNCSSNLLKFSTVSQENILFPCQFQLNTLNQSSFVHGATFYPNCILLFVFQS